GRRAHRKPPRQAPDAPMTLEGVFPDLLAPLPSIAAVEAELARTLRRLVAHARAVAGALGFTPPGDAPVVVTAGRGRLPAELDAWLQASGRAPVGRLALARVTPPGWTRGRAVALQTPPLAGTLCAELVARGAPLRVDDVREGRVPEVSRRVFAERGYRAVALVPLLSARGVFGAVTLASARAGAFDDEDVEIVGELGRPLASAIELRRLLAEGHRRQDELAALYATSQLISARLEMPWVLDRISQA